MFKAVLFATTNYQGAISANALIPFTRNVLIETEFISYVSSGKYRCEKDGFYLIRIQVSGTANTSNNAIVWIQVTIGGANFNQMLSPATKDGGFVSGCIMSPAILAKNDIISVSSGYPSLNLNQGFGVVGSNIAIYVLYS